MLPTAPPEASQATSLPTMGQMDLGGRTLLLRLDLNVPRTAAGHIASDARLRAAVPTIQQAAAAGAKVILASHLGSPGGRPVAADSLLPVVEALCALLDQDIVFCPEIDGSAPRSLLGQLRSGQLMALENLRFWPGEERNDLAFARSLASLCDCYVNDAFGTMHRAHASIVSLPLCVADVGLGPLVEREMAALGRLLRAPQKNFVAIVGGAKVASKVGLLRALTNRAEHLAIGGAMALPFLAAAGHSTGAAQVSKEATLLAQSVVQRAFEGRCRLWLPQDHLAAQEFASKSAAQQVASSDVPAGLLALDVGPKTRTAWSMLAAQADTVFWNGPIGVAEWPAFAGGSLALAQGVAACQGLSVVGGGDSLAVLERESLSSRVGHASTGGGAVLALLEHATLPGLSAIARRGRP